MPNPNPKTDHLTKFEQVSDRPLSKVVGTRYTAEVYEVLASMTDAQNYIRGAVEARMKTDGLLNAEQGDRPPISPPTG